MSIIRTIAPGQAAGRVADIYGQIRQAFGCVPNAFRLHSASPAILDHQWQNAAYYLHHHRLGYSLLASIRMLISHSNDCAYCVGLNEAILTQRAGFSFEQIAAMKLDPATAPLGAKDKAMLLFVLKAVAAPKSVDMEDMDLLRAIGWDDVAIFDAVNHGARNVCADILFDAFKIEKDV